MENQKTKGFPSYERYKDSGIDWIGKIPEHWESFATKRVFYLASEASPKNHNYELLSVYTDIGVKPRKELEERGNKASSTDEYWIVKKGDIVVNKLLAWMGAVGYSAYDGVTSPAYDILRPIKVIEPKFYHYLFRTDMAKQVFRKNSKGIMDMRLRLYFSELGKIMIPFPTLQEQTAIVQFLDDKTAQIDRAISMKEEQIKLLNERKQIMIQEAVTKGLDPTVPMKNSGIEWIGEIPASWEVVKLKYLLVEPLKYGANEAGIEYQPDYPRYIRITDFSIDGLNDKSKLSLSWDTARDYLLQNNDILFARSGATVGKSYQFKKELSQDEHHAFAGYLIKATADEDLIYSDYLYSYSNSDLFQKWRALIYNKATIENIGADKYAQLPVILPELSEQKDILEFISSISEPLFKIIHNLQDQIQALKEYKTTLINEAVTGKIKVN